jgi:[ribosomal protein S18]-alanine N-acetyltransferase
VNRPSILVREFRPADVTAIMEIQLATPEMAQWQAADYDRLSRNAAGMVLVAESSDNAGVLGFVAALLLGEEAEIQNFAVRARHRRCGIGYRLLQETHRRLAGQAVARVFLEVRRSNIAAIDLYAGLGYSQCGLRAHYYVSDREDALVMSLQLSSATWAGTT